MRDYERRAVADAAYEAWRSGRDYDTAWDRAEEAIYAEAPLDHFDAEEVAFQAALHRHEPAACPECGGGVDYPCQCEGSHDTF